jgi:hypothetical protein
VLYKRSKLIASQELEPYTRQKPYEPKFETRDLGEQSSLNFFQSKKIEQRDSLVIEDGKISSTNQEMCVVM